MAGLLDSFGTDPSGPVPMSPPPPPAPPAPPAPPPGPAGTLAPGVGTPRLALSSPPIQLSDGDMAPIPPGITDKDTIDQMVRAWEMQKVAFYQKKAKDTDSPVEAGTRIYSATRAYPNNFWGKYRAWNDHNLGGNTVNEGISRLNEMMGGTRNEDPAASGVGPLNTGGDFAKRVVIGAYTGIPDLVGQGYNVAKHVVAPGTGTAGDAPDIGSLIRSGTHTPDAPAGDDAWSRAQRAVEGGLSGALGGRLIGGQDLGIARTLANIGLAGTGEAASELGGRLAGEPGAYAGGFFGGGGLPMSAMAARLATGRGLISGPLATLTGSRVAHPDAPNIMEGYQRATGGEVPGSRALMNPTGQRLYNAVAAVPGAGNTLNEAMQRTSDQIRGVKNEVARSVAGPGVDFSLSGPGTIGDEVIHGAQTGSSGGAGARLGPGENLPDVRMQQREPWQALDTAMRGEGGYRQWPVSLRPMVTGMDTRLASELPPANIRDRVEGRVDQVASDAPGYQPRSGAPNRYQGPQGSPSGGPWSVANVDVPWSVAKDTRTQSRLDLGEGQIQMPQYWDVHMKKGLTDAMRQTAMRAGQGQAFDQANTSYARLDDPLNRLIDIGGKPNPDGTYRGGMSQTRAGQEITGNLTNPDKLRDLANSSLFPWQNWNRASGQVIHGFGEVGQDIFRPEAFHEATGPKKLDDRSLDYLTQGGPTGAPGTGAPRIRDIRPAAGNFSVPRSASGLISSVGSAAFVGSLLNMFPKMGYPLAAAVARGLESNRLKSAMAGGSSGAWADMAAKAARVNAVEESQRAARLNMSPAYPAARRQADEQLRQEAEQAARVSIPAR
jgi:hypothetical protein